MLKKIVIAGSAAAVVLGAGTAALAASGSTSSPAPSGTAPSSTSGTANHAAGKHAGKARDELRRALHATWVTRDGKNSTTFVTHDAIRGTVTAVSANSITVKALDNVSQTYAVTSSTKVHSRAAAKGATVTISSVKTGDKVLVAGTGTSSLTATRVLDATK
ncbi:MAG TPA: DUF5666 domain-containing protein [Jatrophihabitans sp.]|nr:DUF5666 domain-containing protein [Jatrophihabitans sp.]